MTSSSNSKKRYPPESNSFKLIVIVGPTASGKSSLAIKMARRINGEIISADSRQVYCGMDIGTGKVKRDKTKGTFWAAKVPFVSSGIPHHLLDVVSPKTNFSAGQFVKLAREAITDIRKRGEVPIIVGGTGFYIDALIYNIPLPEVKPDRKLRRQLEKKNPGQLFAMLQKLDPERSGDIDRNNPRRLIRAIEIAGQGSTLTKFKITDFYQKKVSAEFIGLAPTQKKIEQNIAERLKQRMKDGMLAEVKKLHVNGLSWKRLESFGLEYKWLALFLQKKITRAEMLANLERDIIRYAKRQMRWFKRNPNIRWQS